MTDKTPEELVAERGKTHGDWKLQAQIAQELKQIIERHGYLKNGFQVWQRESLEMICVKISRILAGDPNEPDHWDDIAGYAVLGKQGHKPMTMQDLDRKLVGKAEPKKLRIQYKGFAIGDHVQATYPITGPSYKGVVKDYSSEGIFVALDNGNELWFDPSNLIITEKASD